MLTVSWAPLRLVTSQKSPRVVPPCACDAAELVAGPPPSQGRRLELKAELLRAAAACNRGFGATRSDRERITGLFASLSELSPTASPTCGFEGGEDSLAAPALGGCWRLVYTSATDVLSLDAWRGPWRRTCRAPRSRRSALVALGLFCSTRVARVDTSSRGVGCIFSSRENRTGRVNLAASSGAVPARFVL